MARPVSFLHPQSCSLLPAPCPLPNRGLTLIELLIVIIILTTLVAAAIPILAPADSDRRLREATRGLNTYITGAQTRATALRRPFGIALKRLSQDTDTDNDPTNPNDDNGVCVEVFYVEQQPPYAGFDANSRACVALHPGTGLKQVGLVLIQFVTRGMAILPTLDHLPIGWDADLFPGGTIRPGDVIEIGDTRYELLADGRYLQFGQLVNGYYPSNWGAREGSPVTIAARPINDTGQQINVKYDGRGNELGASGNDKTPIRPYWTSPAPYKILRQPTPTSDPPFQMPEGSAIDLRASGIGRDDFFYVPGQHDNADGVLVMFTPEGQISRVYFNPNSGTSNNPQFDDPVVDNVYLLVAKRENIPAPPVSGTGRDPTLNSSDFPPTLTDEERQELKEPINWLSGESRWVVIGPQSGRVVSIENAFVDPNAVMTFGISSNPPIAQSSEQMRNQQIMQAREFTYGMANMGGR